ncbi:50S ribosomal protein L1, mitochondrial [Plasmodium gonderi]|uniref:50S ribosomal protein L1, mitochondrial n=1 Tax=Plasmodium gonderi TaxID=77519 RepID=A0A1Y1J8W6_PLAGO|nr:50S ribosomal protein L1, mitochondrial [Plasmodium gonderi]GAW78946.1 50S ribosomal protein L1, mitochondrial [Plasmodium gonderi]
MEYLFLIARGTIRQSQRTLINRGHDKGKLFFIERRWKKYIPFYDIKTRRKKRLMSEDSQEAENINVNQQHGKEAHSRSEKEELSNDNGKGIRSRNILPAVSPMKGLKLLLSFKHVNKDRNSSRSDSSSDRSGSRSSRSVVGSGPEKEEKINFNLIIKIDIKRESLRGMCNLTHSVDRNKKILVLVDDNHQNLKKCGADYVGLEYINKIKNGWLDFHICLTDFKNINKILPIAKILGPKKLMPNVKSNTLVHNLVDTIMSIKSGNRIEYRSEQVDADTFDLFDSIYNFRKIDLGSIANLNVDIASTSMSIYDTLENMKCFVSEILKNNVHSAHTERDTKPAFTWPPITSKKKKKNQMNSLHLQGSNILDAKEHSFESFLLGAYVTLPGIPKIFLHPHLLHPISNGYSV